MTLECEKVGGINLAQGVCDTEVPAPVRLGAQKAMEDGINSYTRYDGLRVLRDAIAWKMRTSNGIDADPETQITVSAGSTGALYCACLALLDPGWRSSPSPPAQALIRLAVKGRCPIVPVPGPTLPFTAVVVSGLPADSFVYLGELPQQPQERSTLLSSLRHERCTLVTLETTGHLPGLLASLLDVLGDRRLAVVAASERGTETLWRGTIRGALEQPLPSPYEGPRVLVIEGARGPAARWDEERLKSEVGTLLGKGLGAKQVSQQLAAKSGWPRRDVYRLAVEASPLRKNE